MELSTTRDTIGCAAVREHLRILWNAKVHKCIHNTSPLVPILRQTNHISTHASCLSKIHLNIIYPPTSWSSLWSLSHLVNWVPCHHSMVHPLVMDGGNGLQLWKVAANTWNKQPQIADKGWSPSLGVGNVVNSLSP
jgi:hypothetical protein